VDGRVVSSDVVRETHQCKQQESKKVTNLDVVKKVTKGGKIEKNDLGGTCSAYGGDVRLIQGFGGKTCF
jgi:hypothetical protein